MVQIYEIYLRVIMEMEKNIYWYLEYKIDFKKYFVRRELIDRNFWNRYI